MTESSHPFWQRTLDALIAWDRQVSARLVAAVSARRVACAVCAVLARSGDGPIWAIIAVLGLIIGGVPHRATILWIVGAVILTALLVTLVKHTVRRPRPHGIESARWSAMPKHDVYSFPSGHAARVACIACCVGASYPRAGGPIALWVLGVAVARIAVGAHYATDVIAGTLIGILSASLTLGGRFLFKG